MRRLDPIEPVADAETDSPVNEEVDATVVLKPPPPALARWTGYLLHSVSGKLDEMFMEAMKQIELRPYHVAILELLASEGNMAQARLGDRLRVDKAKMVLLLNELEGQGLVERQGHPTDRRAFLIQLLPAGRERLKAAEELGVAVRRDFFQVLSPEERRTLHALLSRLAHYQPAALPSVLKPDRQD